MSVAVSDDLRMVTVRVNGERRAALAEPRTLLADFLRHELGLTGTHVGCEHGVCGACTVRVDGVLARSCIMLAVQAEGRRDRDRRGSGERRRAAPDPGGLPAGARPAVRLLHARALARDAVSARAEPGTRRGRDPRASCPGTFAAAPATSASWRPCGKAAEMLRGVTRVSEIDPGRPAQYVGARVLRVEDPRFLTGQAKYIDDISLPGMLHAAFLRSPQPHARIASIDTSRARALEGVVRVFTGADLKDEVGPFVTALPLRDGSQRDVSGTSCRSTRCATSARRLRRGRRRVAATSPRTRRRCIDVEYEPLPAVIDAEEALKPRRPGAPRGRWARTTSPHIE